MVNDPNTGQQMQVTVPNGVMPGGSFDVAMPTQQYAHQAVQGMVVQGTVVGGPPQGMVVGQPAQPMQGMVVQGAPAQPM